MKPFEARVHRGQNGERPLTTVGYSWNCGCEARGRAMAWCATCFWSPYSRHAAFAASRPVRQVPGDLEGDVFVSSGFKGLQLGWDIFESLPQTA